MQQQHTCVQLCCESDSYKTFTRNCSCDDMISGCKEACYPTRTLSHALQCFSLRRTPPSDRTPHTQTCISPPASVLQLQTLPQWELSFPPCLSASAQHPSSHRPVRQQERKGELEGCQGQQQIVGQPHVRPCDTHKPTHNARTARQHVSVQLTTHPGCASTVQRQASACACMHVRQAHPDAHVPC